MKRLALLLAASIFAVPAFAADMPRKAPTVYKAPAPAAELFNDFYVAGLAGYGWGKAESLVDVSTSGFVGGAEWGARRRIMQNLVLGVAIDGLWSDVNGDKGLGGGFKAEHETRALYSGRAIIGVPVDNFLFYATGGLAAGQGKVTVSGPGGSLSGDADHVGWVAGAGVEWAYAPNWSLKAEYRYYDLGKSTYAADLGGGIKLGVDVKDTVSTGLIGIAYRY